MKCVNFWIEFVEIPRDELLQVFAEHYPRLQRLIRRVGSTMWQWKLKFNMSLCCNSAHGL